MHPFPLAPIAFDNGYAIPSKVLQMVVLNGNEEMQFECGASSDELITIPTDELFAYSGNTLYVQAQADVEGIRDSDTGAVMMFEPLECAKRYAAVRWVGRTGGVCQLTWEVRGFKYGTNEPIAIETIDNTFNTRKGQMWGFTLHMDGLTDYDVWYYSSIITSSKVEVNVAGKWEQVDVLTKEVTIPSGNAGKLHKLDIQVNWRKYDTI